MACVIYMTVLQSVLSSRLQRNGIRLCCLRTVLVGCCLVGSLSSLAAHYEKASTASIRFGPVSEPEWRTAIDVATDGLIQGALLYWEGTDPLAIVSDRGLFCTDANHGDFVVTNDIRADVQVWPDCKGAELVVISWRCREHKDTVKWDPCRMIPDAVDITSRLIAQARTRYDDKLNHTTRLFGDGYSAEIAWGRCSTIGEPPLMAIRIARGSQEATIDGFLCAFEASIISPFRSDKLLTALEGRALSSPEWPLPQRILQALVPLQNRRAWMNMPYTRASRASTCSQLELLSGIRHEEQDAMQWLNTNLTHCLQGAYRSDTGVARLREILTAVNRTLFYGVVNLGETRIHTYNDLYVDRRASGVDPLMIRRHTERVVGHLAVLDQLKSLFTIAKHRDFPSDVRCLAIDSISRMAGFGWGRSARSRIGEIDHEDQLVADTLAAASVLARCANEDDIATLNHSLAADTTDLTHKLRLAEAALLSGEGAVGETRVYNILTRASHKDDDPLLTYHVKKVVSAAALGVDGRKALLAYVVNMPDLDRIGQRMLLHLFSYYENCDSLVGDATFEEMVSRARANVSAMKFDLASHDAVEGWARVASLGARDIGFEVECLKRAASTPYAPRGSGLRNGLRDMTWDSLLSIFLMQREGGFGARLRGLESCCLEMPRQFKLSLLNKLRIRVMCLAPLCRNDRSAIVRLATVMSDDPDPSIKSECRYLLKATPSHP